MIATVEMPSFARCGGADVNAICDCFSAIEAKDHMVTEMHMNELDFEVLKANSVALEQMHFYKVGYRTQIMFWSAEITINENLDKVFFYGKPV